MIVFFRCISFFGFLVPVVVSIEAYTPNTSAVLSCLVVDGGSQSCKFLLYGRLSFFLVCT